MADVVPPGAFTEATQAEQKISTQVLGGPRQAFVTRKDSLIKMRTAVNNHEQRLDYLETIAKDILVRPF